MQIIFLFELKNATDYNLIYALEFKKYNLILICQRFLGSWIKYFLNQVLNSSILYIAYIDKIKWNACSYFYEGKFAIIA